MGPVCERQTGPARVAASPRATARRASCKPSLELVLTGAPGDLRALSHEQRCSRCGGNVS